jgi:hypothetical protein
VFRTIINRYLVRRRVLACLVELLEKFAAKVCKKVFGTYHQCEAITLPRPLLFFGGGVGFFFVWCYRVT